MVPHNEVSFVMGELRVIARFDASRLRIRCCPMSTILE